MKKALHIIAFAAVAIAALTSCAKEEFKGNAIPAGEPIEVSLNGLIGEFTPADATKATAESVVRVTWGEGDKVYVYDGSNASIGTLIVTPDNNNASYAMLSGTITASAASPAPSKLTLVYVKGATEAPTIAGGKISVDLSSQNQTEVPFVLYTTVAYDAAALTKTNEYISFNFATSVMTVNCTGLQTGDSGAVTGIDRAEIDGVSTACELTIDGSGVTAVAGTTPGKITRTETAEPSVFTQSDSRGSFRLALAADPAAPAARNIIVHQGSKVSGAPFTTATLAGGKSYNTVYQMGEYVAPPAGMLPGEFTVNANGKKVHFSQGNLYAKKTGANWAWNFYDNQYGYNSLNSQCEEGYRNATEGDTEIDLFTWGYNAVNSINPTYDDYEIGEVQQLSKSDDWGYVFGGESSAWRTLSIAEWRYLFAWTSSGVNTDTESPRYNHYKYGVTVCGKANCVVLLPDDWNETIIPLTQFADITNYDSASIPTWKTMEDAGAVCLPAAGDRNGSTVSNVGKYGSYWSSSGFDVDAACYVSIGDWQSDDVNPNKIGSRISGFSVRLVTEASGGYAPAVKVSGVSLNKTETTIEAGATETLVANVLPANAANKQINWLSSNTSVATVDATSGEVTGVAEGSAVITATTADGNFTAVCLVTVTPKPDYVVMKMSTGDSEYTRKWRIMNLGATTVAGSYATCYGDLYQWGSLHTIYDGSPYTSATTGSFTFKEGKSDGFHPSSMEYYGEADLTLANDVANKILGSGYRIPTSQEFKDLYDACGGDDKFDETTNPGKDTQVGQGTYWCDNYDNVAGVLFCDGTNKLFFPAAGLGYNTGLDDAGSYGYYLSSNIVPDALESARDLLFYYNTEWGYVDPQSNDCRHFGFSVRPVLDE